MIRPLAHLSAIPTCPGAASESTLSAVSGALAPASSAGFPLRFPSPWLAGAVAFGLGQLYILAFNDALLPAALRALYYSIVGDNSTAQTIAVVATAVHVVEGGVALGICLKRRYALTATLYWTLLSFIFGFPGLLLLRDLGTPKPASD